MTIRIRSGSRFSRGTTALLGERRKSIILSQKADDRLSSSISGFKCSWHAADTHFHLKSFLIQNFFEELRSFEFSKSNFCVVENLIAYFKEQILFIVD